MAPSLVELLAGMELDHFVQPDHADQIRDPVHAQIGAPSRFMVSRARGPVSPSGAVSGKGPFLEMGLHRQFQDLGHFGKERGVVSPGLIGEAGEIEGHVLQGAIPHAPGLLGVVQVRTSSLKHRRQHSEILAVFPRSKTK